MISIILDNFAVYSRCILDEYSMDPRCIPLYQVAASSIITI